MRSIRGTLGAVCTCLVLAPAALAADPIQPGAYMSTADAGCTMNFVYDGTGASAGKVFVGTAAHCVSKLASRSWTRAASGSALSR